MVEKQDSFSVHAKVDNISEVKCTRI